jgi:hypothetical protein
VTTSRKILLSLTLVGVLGTVAGVAAFSAFSSSATTSGAAFSAGTVQLGANDAGNTLYSVANTKPGDTVTACIKVTYSGTLAADVRLYTPDTIGALGPYLNLTITPGTQASSTYPSCTGFTPFGSGAIYSGTLAGFATAHNSWANGLGDYPVSATKWSTGDSIVYQFTVTLQDVAGANGGAGGSLTTGSHRFSFEARNQ